MVVKFIQKIDKCKTDFHHWWCVLMKLSLNNFLPFHFDICYMFVVFLFCLLALVEEIFAAQKEHDEAILARMKLVNDERDDALNRAKRMEDRDGFDSGTDVNSNDEDFSQTDVVSIKWLIQCSYLS